MIIEGILSVALVWAETTIEPPPIPNPPPVLTCYDDLEGGLTCYPIDESDKVYGR
jgi:hypothetical protein